MYWIYILYSNSLDRYYIGYSSNFEARLIKHNRNHTGFTGKANDWSIVYTEKADSKTKAIIREQQIKKWKSRKRIEKLIMNNKA